MKTRNGMLVERLKHEMNRLGVNARQLATEASVGQSFVYDVLSGKSGNPTTSKLAAVAEVLGVSVPYLVNGTMNDNDVKVSSQGNYLAITQITPNKEGIICRDDILFPKGRNHFFHKDWVKSQISDAYNDLRALVVQGDYMHPALRQGDLVLIDMTRTRPNPPGIFAIYDGTGLVLKRLEYLPTNSSDVSGVRVSSDNSPNSSYSCPLTELDIIGRVVWISRLVD